MTVSDRYSGWAPKITSLVLGLMQQVYQYLGLNAISIGPTIRDVHTPNEALEIESVKKLIALLLETIRRVPAK